MQLLVVCCCPQSCHCSPYQHGYTGRPSLGPSLYSIESSLYRWVTTWIVSRSTSRWRVCTSWFARIDAADLYQEFAEVRCMGIFGRFSRDRPRPEPTGHGDPHNRRRSMGISPTAPSSELQPAPHPHQRAPSAPSAAPSDDGTAELPLEDHQQAPEPYAGFSEPGTPPTSRKGSTALLNSQGSIYRQQNSVPPANGTSGISSSLSPGTVLTCSALHPCSLAQCCSSKLTTE